MGAVVKDEAFVAGAADSEVGGAFGALRVLDNLLTERIESRWRACGLESKLDIFRFDLAAVGNRRGSNGTGSGKPERLRIQGEETGRRSGGVAKLEAQFDGGDVSGRPR